jgi:hypothetical protein
MDKSSLTRLYAVKGYIKQGSGVYEIRYVKGDTRKLFKVMYADESGLYLTRKYEKIKTAFELDERVKKEYHRKRSREHTPQ